jgi:hypothetical protein
MGNGNSLNNNINQTLMLGNGNLPISQTKKNSSLLPQNNPFPFLPSSSSNQNKYNNMQAPLISSLQRAPAMTNFIQTQNGQSPPPPPHIMNGNDMEQNFPPMNVKYIFRFIFIQFSFIFYSRMMHMI